MPVIRTASIGAADRTRLAPLIEGFGQRGKAVVVKAQRHLADPQHNPIDASRSSLEGALVEALRAAPPARQARMRAAPMVVNAAALPINSADARSVFVQWPMPWSEFRDLWQTGGDPPTPPAAPAQGLELRLHSVYCESDSPEIFKDEIDLGTTVTVFEPVAGGQPKSVYSKVVNPFRVGSFKKGRRVEMNRRVLATLPLSGSFPKVASATLLLVEKDFGDSKWLLDALKKLKDIAEKEIKGYIEGKVDGKFWEDALKYAIAVFLDAILKELLKWLQDDPFDPVTATISVPAVDAVAIGGGRTSAIEELHAHMRDGSGRSRAHYVLRHDWNLV